MPESEPEIIRAANQRVWILTRSYYTVVVLLGVYATSRRAKAAARRDAMQREKKKITGWHVCPGEPGVVASTAPDGPFCWWVEAVPLAAAIDHEVTVGD